MMCLHASPHPRGLKHRLSMIFCLPDSLSIFKQTFKENVLKKLLKNFFSTENYAAAILKKAFF